MLGSTDITQTANTTEPQPQQTPTLTISGGHAPSLDHVIHPERPKAPTYIFDFDRLNESDDSSVNKNNAVKLVTPDQFSQLTAAANLASTSNSTTSTRRTSPTSVSGGEPLSKRYKFSAEELTATEIARRDDCILYLDRYKNSIRLYFKSLVDEKDSSDSKTTMYNI